MLIEHRCAKPYDVIGITETRLSFDDLFSELNSCTVVFELEFHHHLVELIVNVAFLLFFLLDVELA